MRAKLAAITAAGSGELYRGGRLFPAGAAPEVSPTDEDVARLKLSADLRVREFEQVLRGLLTIGYVQVPPRIDDVGIDVVGQDRRDSSVYAEHASASSTTTCGCVMQPA